ncbi:glycerol kinase GlpK [Salipaludibacillus neizhouensis]|nr:glycerol kinase GlpK [Salipaludibacillus neizhouensis]
MDEEYILSIDQSTSGTKVLLIDSEARIIHKKSKNHRQLYPQAGWVEHDPMEIYENVKRLIREVMDTSTIPREQLKVLTITNQRETVLIWDKQTGGPVHNAIVWQCRRTTDICKVLKEQGIEAEVKARTGLTLDPYFSSSKVKWLMDNVEGVRERAEQGNLLMGTIDTWLIWKLTNGTVHSTDITNASRTMLYNIHALQWDDVLLDVFDIPSIMLPRVQHCDEIFGTVMDPEIACVGIRISGVIGDSQGALFGQRCFEKGMAKATFGTGTSVLVFTDDLVESKNGLVTSVAWGKNGKVSFAQEGIIHSTGDVIKWMIEDLGLINDISEVEALAESVPNNEGVYLVPAFVGLGAPYWSPETRAAITGMSRGTNKAHIIRAALESIAYQVKDVLELVEEESGIKIKEIRADGGAASNQFLMQYLADLLGINVIVSDMNELSTLGSAYLGGLGAGIWNSQDELTTLNKNLNTYQSKFSAEINGYHTIWKNMVQRVLVTSE